ncbi:AraC family transcriptional regulator [Pelagicoccus sp. SDUM812005]|uniref:helix-turn-helix domain-containing protein n=1 Tax=Pelagicoccus sp. SDUM812005 TaxID=3041257 RepID=UPI00280F54FE|nr:AraC family transcriptional regulator [Pelagicoccus sp. SDUM812005]MDQ8180522.1 AraC family transcriptional regulator [Pelagicoccus sp. SDUM812005]
MNEESERVAIKHMVCPRCIATVESIVLQLGFKVESVTLGEAWLGQRLTQDELSLLAEKLEANGFEILVSKERRLINKIKSLILERIHYSDMSTPEKLSVFLANSLRQDYSYLSKVFSSVEAMTIERYFMLQRVERAKELLSYDEQNVTEIAEMLDFSSAAHFSAQFKRETGMSPREFKSTKPVARRSIDTI